MRASLRRCQAHAEGYVSPWAGIAFGSSADNSRGTFGVNAGGMGAGIIGGEVDFGYSPSFFGYENPISDTTLSRSDGQRHCRRADRRHPWRGRPAVRHRRAWSVRTQIDGGTLAQVSSQQHVRLECRRRCDGLLRDHFGLRGDMRYMRGFEDLDTGATNFDFNNTQLHFWRASIGVVFR